MWKSVKTHCNAHLHNIGHKSSNYKNLSIRGFPSYDTKLCSLKALGPRLGVLGLGGGA